MLSNLLNGRFTRRSLAVIVSLLLVLSVTVAAYAATLTIGIDPFTQATCKASNTTNHQANVEPDSFSLWFDNCSRLPGGPHL